MARTNDDHTVGLDQLTEFWLLMKRQLTSNRVKLIILFTEIFIFNSFTTSHDFMQPPQCYSLQFVST